MGGGGSKKQITPGPAILPQDGGEETDKANDKATVALRDEIQRLTSSLELGAQELENSTAELARVRGELNTNTVEHDLTKQQLLQAQEELQCLRESNDFLTPWLRALKKQQSRWYVMLVQKP